MKYYLKRGSALKDSRYILTLSFWLLSKLKFIVQLKNSLYIILNHLFYDLLSFYIWYFDSYMYISDLNKTFAWNTYSNYHILQIFIIYLWITSSSYTYYQNLSLKHICGNLEVSEISACGEHYLSFYEEERLKDQKNSFKLFSFDMIYN